MLFVFDSFKRFFHKTNEADLIARLKAHGATLVECGDPEFLEGRGAATVDISCQDDLTRFLKLFGDGKGNFKDFGLCAANFLQFYEGRDLLQKLCSGLREEEKKILDPKPLSPIVFA